MGIKIDKMNFYFEYKIRNRNK